jgi:hypothetical protein
VAEFTWSFDDTMVNSAGATVDFGVTTVGAANLFDVIKLPVGAIVIGGQLTVLTAFDTAAYTIILGDTTTANRYLASADLKAVGTTALLMTGFRNPTGLDLRLSIANTDVCTTGVASLRVHYIIDGRCSEVTAGPA